MNAAFDKEIVHQDVAMDVDSSLFPSFPQIYFWTHQFNKVQNRFCTLMHLKNTAAARLESIVKVDQDLAAWRDALPPVCRPNNMILVSPDKYSNVLLMHLEYFNLLRAIHWAVITLKSSHNGISERLDYRLRASEALCVEAARSFIKCLNE